MKTITRLFVLFTLVWGLVTPATYSVNGQAFLTNGLVAYYPFNGNADDASGNGHHGNLDNVSFVYDRHGFTNGAASFAGNSSSRITISSTEFNLAPDFTVCAWINFTAGAGTENPRVFSTAGYEIGTQTTSENRFAYFDNTTLSAGAPTINSSNTISAGKWWQIVGVRTGSQMFLYVNGGLAGSLEVTQAPDYSRNFVPAIAGNSGSAADNYGGLIDDIRIYNRALSADEIQQLYVFELGPKMNLIKAVKPSFDGLTLGRMYQLQLSQDLNTWTNQGSPFTATNTSMIYPQYWDVANWSELYFRLQVSP